MSLWTMGFNQHVRGVWANQLVYNLHLLTGKISEPGNSPFSLTGQPSACGTAREVGTFAHRLPADMVGDQSRASQACRGNLARAERHHPREARLSRGRAGPHAPGRQAQFLLDHGQQQPAGRAEQHASETYPGYRNPDNFIVVSDAYPTVTAMAADLILPAAMWVEKEGAYGNAERRTHFWRQLVNAPGEARSDLWQIMEFSKRFTTDEVWPAEIARRQIRTIAASRCSTCCSAMAVSTIPGHEIPADYENRESKAFGFYVQKGLFEEYATFGRGHGHDLAPFDTYHEERGLRWPVVDGKETRWRYREGYDPYVKPGKGVEFYGHPDGRARIIAVPYEPPAESPDNGIRPLACHRPCAGTLAFRLDDHAGAGTLQSISRRASASCMPKMRARAASIRVPKSG